MKPVHKILLGACAAIVIGAVLWDCGLFVTSIAFAGLGIGALILAPAAADL